MCSEVDRPFSSPCPSGHRVDDAGQPHSLGPRADMGLLRREAEMAPLLASLSGRMGAVITEDKSGSAGAGAQVTAR